MLLRQLQAMLQVSPGFRFPPSNIEISIIPSQLSIQFIVYSRSDRRDERSFCLFLCCFGDCESRSELIMTIIFQPRGKLGHIPPGTKQL